MPRTQTLLGSVLGLVVLCTSGLAAAETDADVHCSADGDDPRPFFGLQLGGYGIHARSDATPSGTALGALVGVRTGPVAPVLTLTRGHGEDAFWAVEPAVQVHPWPGYWLHFYVGAGIGLLFEDGGATSLPRFVQLGLGLELEAGWVLRGELRQGAHPNMGDDGPALDGPNTLTVALLYLL